MKYSDIYGQLLNEHIQSQLPTKYTFGETIGFYSKYKLHFIVLLLNLISTVYFLAQLGR